jgi:hypothetical protein
MPSNAKPGGRLLHIAQLVFSNATGFTVFEYAIAAKWLELLKEVAPSLTRVAVLRDANVASGIGQFAAIQTVAPIGTELSVIGVRNAGEVENAIAALGRDFRRHRPPARRHSPIQNSKKIMMRNDDRLISVRVQ